MIIKYYTLIFEQKKIYKNYQFHWPGWKNMAICYTQYMRTCLLHWTSYQKQEGWYFMTV